MSLGYSKEFNDATRPGFDPDAAEAAMRRLKDTQDMQNQQAFQRQLSGAAEDSGEISQAVGAMRQAAEDSAKADEKERKERVDRQALLASLEGRLEAQYGQHFAENLLADLREDGLIEDDEYTRIMAITDEDERRIAIAAAIQRGIDEGRIDPDDLAGHPWAEEWLGSHRAAAAQRDREAELGLSGERAASELSTDAQFEADLRSAGSTRDTESEFESATVDTERNNVVDNAGANLLSGRGLG